MEVNTPKLGLGVFENYDNVVLLCGLNLDKRVINEKFRRAPKHVKIFTSNISDSQLYAMLFYKGNFNGSSPFSDKNVVLLYGDGPYTSNDLVENVYIQIPEDSHVKAEDLQRYAYDLAENGMWGWEILSYVLMRYFKLTGGGHPLKYKIAVPNRDRDREERLNFLMRLSSPGNIVRSGNGEIVLSDDREIVGYSRVVEIPIYRFLPAFSPMINDILGRLEGKTAVVTLGGPEHNVFLNYFICEQRQDQINQVFFDASNVFDLEAFRRDPHNKVLLDTHNYVGFRLISPQGDVISLSREDPKGVTGGLIVVLSRMRSELTNNKPFDLFVVVGAGKLGALATKLSFLKLLLKSTVKSLEGTGIYYVVFNKDNMDNVYQKVDIVYKSLEPLKEWGGKKVVDFLEEEKLEKASRVYAML
jgi:hypothetical protein